MAQREGERRIETCKESEAAFEVFVRRQADDLTEQRHDDADECQQYDGDHQALHQEYPVVGIRGTRIGEERHTRNQRGEDGDAYRPGRNLASASEVLRGVLLLMGEPDACADSCQDGQQDNNVINPMHSYFSLSLIACSSSADRRVSGISIQGSQSPFVLIITFRAVRLCPRVRSFW